MDEDYLSDDLGPDIFVGVVLDFAQRSKSDFDYATKAVKQLAVALRGRVYVAHPESYGVPARTVAAIDNYNWKDFQPLVAIRQVVGVIGPQDGTKFILVITDNYQAKLHYHFHKANLLNKQKNYGCQVCFIGIGSKYDKESFLTLCDSCINSDTLPICQVHHLSQATQLGEKLLEIVGINGNRENILRTTDHEDSIPDGSV